MTRRRAVLTAGALLSTLAARALGMTPEQSGSLRFEIYRDNRANYRWRLKAANGRVIATSGEGYKAKAACREGVDLVMRGAATAAIQE